MAEDKDQTAKATSPVDKSWLVTALMMVAAGTAVLGFGVLFNMWWSSRVTDPHEILRIASQEYVAGREIVAGELAETVQFPFEVPSPDSESDGIYEELPPESETDTEVVEDVEGEAAEETEEDLQAEWVRLRDFLVGAGKVARSRDAVDARTRRQLLSDAIPSLESSGAGGFPAGREAEGHQLLGQSLYDVSRFAESARHFRAAIELDLALERELMPSLARAQLKSSENMVGDALRTIERYLSDTTLKRDQQREAESIRIEALIGLAQWKEAAAAIEAAIQPVPAGSVATEAAEADYRDRIKLLRAVLQIKRASQTYGARPRNEGDDRSEVIAALSPTMHDLVDLQREAAPKVAARARLWAARANLIQGKQDDALTQLTAARQQRPFGAEGIVGGIEEIELLAEQGRGIEVLQTVRYIIRELGDPSGFDASMIPFEEFRRRTGDAIAMLRTTGQFKDSIDVARSLPPVFEQADALMHEGLGYRDWAAMTIKEGTDIGGDVARSASIVARSRYRAAGDAFAEAAQLQFNTEEYLPTQWSAIDAYQKGRHFRRSIQLLEPYLRYEERRRQPRGLVAYGRALLAEGDAERAIESLNSVIIEFPRDPLRYDARLLSAQAHAELGNLEDAQIMLTENLQDGELTPQSPAWRDSLLTLGETLYREAYANHLASEHLKPEERIMMMRDNQINLEQSVRYLDEAVQRYWPLPRSVVAAYLSAKAHVMAAQWPRVESESTEILDAARRSLRVKADKSLKTALDGFVFLRKHLSETEEEHRLSEREQAMLRNCLMAEADTLREMNDLEKAADAYRTVSLRYMNEPPALEAILGQSRCMKELGRYREADALIQQAEIVLQRIPSEWDDEFENVTRYDRAGWEKLLTWMNKRIQTAGLGNAPNLR